MVASRTCRNLRADANDLHVTLVACFFFFFFSSCQGAHSIFVATDLGECITGVMMVKVWGGVTLLMQSWGKPNERDLGLAQVEEGIGYALTRPGLFTFPLW